MSFQKKMVSLALVSIPWATSLLATDYFWTGNSNNIWNNNGNWIPSSSYPQIIDDTANFTAPSSQSIVQVATPTPTITSLLFSTTNNYTIQPQVSGNILDFSASSSLVPPSITVTAGQHTLASDTEFIDFLSGSPLDIIISDPAASLNWQTSNSALNPPNFINFTGPGKLIIENFVVSNTSRLQASETIYIRNGTVIIHNQNPVTAAEGADLTAKGITLINADLQVANSGNLNSSIFGATINISNGSFIVTNGSISNINSGSIIDSLAGVVIQSSKDFSLVNGSISNINRGSITNSNAGAAISNGRNFIITNGSISNINSGSIIDSLGGASISNGEDFIVTNGSVLNINSAQSNAVGAASVFRIGHDLFFNGGSFQVINSGFITQSIGSLVQVFGNATMNGGTLSLHNSGAVVDMATSGASFTSNLFTLNAGIVTISNTGTQSSGPISGSSFITASTVLNGGTVVNDDTFGANSLTIKSGASFAGSGRVVDQSLGGTSQVLNGGIVSPGDPGPGGIPGTLTINGSYTQIPSGTLVINFDNSSSSELVVTGSTHIAGVLEVARTSGSPFSPKGTYTILQAANVQGQFSSILNFNLPYLIPHVTYLPNEVDVFFSPVVQKYVNLTQPQFSSLNETFSRLTKRMGNLRSRFAKPQATSQQKISFSGKQKLSDTSYQLVSIQDDEPLQSFLHDDAKENEILSFQEQTQPLPEEKKQRLTQSLGSDRPWNFYVGPKGQVGNVLSKEDTQGYKDWSAGAFTGFDYAFSEVGAGFIAEYERIKANVGNDWGHFVINNVHADAYATYAPSSLPELSVNGIVGGGYEWYSVHYNVTDGLSTKGSFQGAEFDTQLEVEYSFRNSVFTGIPEKLQIIPLASIQYMYIHIDDYKEKGPSGVTQKVSRQNQKSLRSTLGMRINYEWDFQDVKFSPELVLSWQREFLDKERKVHFTPTQFSEFGFSLEIPKSGRNIALIGADFLVTLYDRHGLDAGYDFEYNSLYHTHFMYLSYNVRF